MGRSIQKQWRRKLIFDPAWLQMGEEGNLDGFPITLLEETISTSEGAMEQAGNGAAAYSVVVAETQTGGRGRLGKSWQSPPGTGIYCSIILQPDLCPEDLPKITLAAGLAAAKALEAVTKLSIGIKWPNDLILEERKLGGILCETAGMQREARPVVILGIGININSPRSVFPADLQDTATSLLIVTGSEHCRSDLLKAILLEVKKTVELFEREGFALILSEWRQRDVTLGRELSWVTMTGDVVKGVSMGSDDSGQLLIRDKRGRIHEVLSGDVNILKNS